MVVAKFDKHFVLDQGLGTSDQNGTRTNRMRNLVVIFLVEGVAVDF